MNHDVVVGGHHVACLQFGRIPGRGDVSGGPLKNCESRHARERIFPLAIGFGKMSAQGPKWCRFGIYYQRNMVGEESIRAKRDQRRETVLADQAVENINALFAEIGWDIQKRSPSVSALDPVHLVVQRLLHQVHVRAVSGRVDERIRPALAQFGVLAGQAVELPVRGEKNIAGQRLQ